MIRNFSPFTKTSNYYDSIYNYRNVKGECSAIQRIFHKYNTHKTTSVVDLGCGTGVHTIELAASGYQVTGVDRSMSMLKIAKHKSHLANLSPSFVHSQIASFTPNHQFDATISLFDVLSYMVTPEETLSFFSTASRVTKSGGIFIFDCWYGPGVLTKKPNKQQKRFVINGGHLIKTKLPTLHTHKNVVEVKQKITTPSGRRFSETHFLRYFFVPEIQAYLTIFNFSLLAWGNLMDSSIKPEHALPWSVSFIARRG